MNLKEKRLIAANESFYNNEFAGVKDCDNWCQDNIYFSRRIYWDNPDDEDGDSLSGSYGVEFEPNSDNIVAEWWQ